MTDYRTQEDDLFKEMRDELQAQGIKGFIKDGMVDPEMWEKARVKCIFLLKEPWGDETDNRSLVQLLHSGHRDCNGPTWKNVARWVYSIEHIGESGQDYYKVVKPEGDTPDRRQAWLRHIVAINLKKENGRSTTNAKDLRKWFKQHTAKWLPQQLKIYSNAEVIVCCGEGVMDCLKSVFLDCFGEVCPPAQTYDYKQETGSQYDAKIEYYTLRNTLRRLIIIDYWHPSALVKDEKKNNVLKNMIKKLVITPQSKTMNDSELTPKQRQFIRKSLQSLKRVACYTKDEEQHDYDTTEQMCE